jgi:hypothetical protein
LSEKNSQRKPLAVVRPKYYAVENCEAATGFTYRYVRDQARALGVKVYALSGGRRLAIDADDFDLKLQQFLERTTPENNQEQDQDPTAIVLRTLGLEVRK